MLAIEPAVEGAAANKLDKALHNPRRRLRPAPMHPFEMLVDGHSGTIVATAPDIFFATLVKTDEGGALAVLEELFIEVTVA